MSLWFCGTYQWHLKTRWTRWLLFTSSSSEPFLGMIWAVFDTYNRFPGNTSDWCMVWRVLDESYKSELRCKARDLTNAQSPPSTQWALQYKTNLQDLLKVSITSTESSAFILTHLPVRISTAYLLTPSVWWNLPYSNPGLSDSIFIQEACIIESLGFTVVLSFMQGDCLGDTFKHLLTWSFFTLALSSMCQIITATASQRLLASGPNMH